MNDEILKTVQLSVNFGNKQALKNVDMPIPKNKATALIGPSGCGKSTFIRSINRMHDYTKGTRITGEVIFDGKNIYSADVDPMDIRRRIGMVFQQPNPFMTMSIYENVAFGPRMGGVANDDELDGIVIGRLKSAALWDEVKDRLDETPMCLSGGQQQRLCIARALAVEPEVILMDEPCSALDPIATSKIEDLIEDLKKKYTVIIVTHNMQQAARVSDYTGFMYLGKLVEFDETEKIFENPKEELTEKYITGRFG